jgi:hypothetical protein
MGLCISVGFLAELAVDDPDALEDIRQDFQAINQVLRSNHLPVYTEPETLPELDDRTAVVGFPYSFLHYLRRFYARCVNQPGVIPPPITKEEDPTKDPILDKVASNKHHLLWHSDCEGFYVPIDFPLAIEDKDLSGAYLGSSVRLMSELISVAKPLGIQVESGQLSNEEANAIAKDEEAHLYYRERLVWLSLFEAARLSLKFQTAICFS